MVAHVHALQTLQTYFVYIPFGKSSMANKKKQWELNKPSRWFQRHANALRHGPSSKKGPKWHGGH